MSSKEIRRMERVCDYTIVHGFSNEEIAQEVGRLLSEGWQPFCMPINHYNTTRFYQAMVKYEEE